MKAQNEKTKCNAMNGMNQSSDINMIKSKGEKPLLDFGIIGSSADLSKLN